MIGLVDKIKRYIFGEFTPSIKGVKYGFAIMNEGRVDVFEINESVDYDNLRFESFPSAEAAVDGFMIEGKPLGAYALDTVEVFLQAKR